MWDSVKLILLWIGIPILGVLVSCVGFLISCILGRLVTRDKENKEWNL